MSDTTALYSRETCENIPYGKYFEFFPYNKWSLHHYVTLVIDSYELAEKEKAHRVFYKILGDIINNEFLEEEVHSIAQNLIKNSKVGIFRMGVLNMCSGFRSYMQFPVHKLYTTLYIHVVH